MEMGSLRFSLLCVVVLVGISIFLPSFVTAQPSEKQKNKFAGWGAARIKKARKACNSLPSDHFEFRAVPAIHRGACGDPMPIAVKYINLEPRLEFRPVAKLNCRVAGALDRWIRQVVQPKAWELLDARVIRVVVAASYHCRTRSNGSKLSEHAFANAIDISKFITAKGERISVQKHWRAGDERARFLKDIHKGACRIFGTVLGPNADVAHRTHFHLDMTPRRHSAYCR
jgi:hypothetical protein